MSSTVGGQVHLQLFCLALDDTVCLVQGAVAGLSRCCDIDILPMQTLTFTDAAQKL
jgi:hypothetical protein